MPNELRPVYWDSCVFIDLLMQTKGRFDACDAIHREAEKKQIIIVTSTVTLAEVTRIADQGVIPDALSDQILDYFENQYIAVRQLDRELAKDAHRLCRKFNLMGLDGVHLATALDRKVDVLYTYDSKKNRRKGLLKWHNQLGSGHAGLIGADGYKLRVEAPTVPVTLLTLPQPEEPPPSSPPAMKAVPEKAKSG
ncbi:MAG TPA: type II toxin-antitoxin system VapC family toxin [Urbifossiella sp.]|nr:type II toxin-antitoxin system VapC family toxin [Urbifossiella sp.]